MVGGRHIQRPAVPFAPMRNPAKIGEVSPIWRKGGECKTGSPNVTIVSQPAIQTGSSTIPADQSHQVRNRGDRRKERRMWTVNRQLPQTPSQTTSTQVRKFQTGAGRRVKPSPPTIHHRHHRHRRLAIPDSILGSMLQCPIITFLPSVKGTRSSR